jgi:acyl carrier protein
MESRVKQIMGDVLGIDPDLINESTRMDSVGTWDSLNHINLCASLEEEFDTSLSVSDIESMVTYPGILKVLRSKQ